MMEPDPWQREALGQIVTRGEDALLDCSSQIGKTETVAAAAYLAACLGSFVLVVSPSDRQSVNFHRRLLEYHSRLRLVEAREDPNKHELWLTGGGHVAALPNSPDKIRGEAAVNLLVIDEAARCSDDLYVAVSRMLATTRGQRVLLSTPKGKRGFFWNEWSGQGRKRWRRHKVQWNQCPRISPEHIEDERLSHGDQWIAQEYECEFLAEVGGCFNTDAMLACADDSVEEWT